MPERLPPQLVIRRFLPAFTRPFLAVFIGKIFSLPPPPPGEDLVLARAASLRALSSSLIEYSPLYLRMPVEIYRRSRSSFRFVLCPPSLSVARPARLMSFLFLPPPPPLRPSPASCFYAREKCDTHTRRKRGTAATPKKRVSYKLPYNNNNIMLVHVYLFLF